MIRSWNNDLHTFRPTRELDPVRLNWPGFDAYCVPICAPIFVLPKDRLESVWQALARITPSGNNIIELDRVRLGPSGRASASRNLCHDLCPDFPKSPTPRKAKKSRKKELAPALIDDLRVGKLDDSRTGALSIEVLPSGKKRWFYRRRIAGRGVVVKFSLGLYPAYSIAAAREWASGLNLQMDAGIDPRETARQELRLATMTVDRAHELYMEAVREGRSSRAKRIGKACR